MLAAKNLLRRKIRTLLSIIGVGVGTASIIAFGAMGKGFKESFVLFLKGTGANFMVMDKNVSDAAFSRIAPEDVEKIRKVKGVSDCSRLAFTFAKLPGFPIPALPTFGREPGSRMMEKYKKEITEGRVLENLNEAIVGSLIVEKLNAKIGSEFPLFDKKMKVVGIYKSTVPWENGGVVVHIDVVREQLKIPEGGASIVLVYVDDVSRHQQIEDEIRDKFPHLTTVRADNVLQHFADQIIYVDYFVWVVSVAALAVGGIGVLNTMLMSVSERTREIGTLRAQGWSKVMVMRLLVLEGVVISVIGGIVGCFMGVAGAEILVSMVPQGFLSTMYDQFIFLQGFAVSIIVGFFGSLYPAFQASNLSPAEALRYE